MNNKINTELLKKYLQGLDLTKAELTEVEAILMKDEALAEEIAKDLKEISLPSTLKKGIKKAGQQTLKKKIIKVSDNLTAAGFFLDETDIHAYLKGTLAEEKVKSFEQKLEQEEDFALKVEKEQHLLEGLKKAGQAKLKEKIAKVQTGLEEKGFFEESSKTEQVASSNTAKIKPLFSRRLLAIAASLLVLVVAYFAFPTEPAIDINQTFANHTPFPDRISEMIQDELSEIGYTASEKEFQEQMLEGMKEYELKGYKKAIGIFEDIIAKKPDELYATFYLAQSHLNLQQWDLAQSLLHPLGENSTFPLRAESLWSESYVLLKQNNKTAALNNLKQLSQYENPYQDLAGKMMKSIENE